MNPPLSLQQRFDQAAMRYHAALKYNIESAAEKASDKEYAYDYYRRTQLERNPEIPYNSAFFQALSAAFLHNLRLYPLDVVENTLSSLPRIRELCADAVEAAMGGRMPEVYNELMKTEGCTLEQLLARDISLRTFAEEDVLEILALYYATLVMLGQAKWKPEDEEEEEDEPESVVTRFTRSQQALVAKYLFSQAGIPAESTDVTARTELLLALTASATFSKSKDTDLYKIMRDPLGHSRPSQTIKNLLVIRPFFEKLKHTEILAEIDRDIARVTNKLKK